MPEILKNFSESEAQNPKSHAAAPETAAAEVCADRQRGDSFVVGLEGFGDAGERGAVAVLLQACQALLGVGELLQAVQPEVEVL